ncbi:EpsG family protein [Gammaproteobacteria bacterium]|nr:EpsG family protein [Gammaproteobacteria bacterium]
MLKNKEYKYLSTNLILLISMIFAILVGSGFYGYGNDFYEAYYKPNLNWGGIFERLGWRISTFTINETHIGVYIVTFVLAVTSGSLIREHIKFKHSYSLIFFLSLYLLAIHTWPIIMSTSNAMRQGLSMSFIFVSLVSSSRKNFYWTLLFSLLAIFTHKIGMLLVLILVLANIVNNTLTSFSYKTKIIVNFSLGLFLLITAYYSLGILGFVFASSDGSRIIGGDYRLPFVFISCLFISLSFFYKDILNNSFNLYLYYFSFISLSFFLNNLNWQYERLGMMMLIPYILSFGGLLNRFSYKIYLVLIFLALIFLTVFAGMYASLN